MFLFWGWDDGFGGWWGWWYGREQKVGSRGCEGDEPRRVGCGKPLTGGDTRGMKRTKKAATVGM